MVAIIATTNNNGKQIIMHALKYLYILPLIFAVIALPGNVNHTSAAPVYRIVLDPGHGGVCLPNKQKHGDRYDSLSGRYLSDFAMGAAHRGLWEHILVYQIAEKTKKILDLCSPDATESDFNTFNKILKRYTSKPAKRIHIITHMSRGNSSNIEEIKKRKDPNAEFRLYDYPDSKGIMQPGRISKINALKPHLVVSLHMTCTTSRIYQGMSAVIIAPHTLMNNGLMYLKGKKSSSFFRNSSYTDWFQESNQRSSWEWFLNDSVFYFTSFPMKRNRSMRLDRFRGYRYNMIQWAYRDSKGWEKAAASHPAGTQYANSFRTFAPLGKFWEREKSKYELFRREGGPEGFGGDNYFAAAEILRFMIYSLHLRGEDHPHQKLTRPFISTWSIPLHINAVSAYLELGSLRNSRHRYLFTRKQNELAEGIAVGIYSLFAGIEPSSKKFRYTPKGKEIDYSRYKISHDTTYFDVVVEE